MEAVQRVARIEDIINRLDCRGKKFMDEAVENCKSPRFEEYVARLTINTNRCRRLAAYINRLSRPKRRTA
jgi:hypothetical protein